MVKKAKEWGIWIDGRYVAGRARREEAEAHAQRMVGGTFKPGLYGKYTGKTYTLVEREYEYMDVSLF